MKKILSLLAFLGLFGSAVAQNAPVKFGVKAGIAFPSLLLSGDGVSLGFDSKTSFYVGGIADIPVSNIFSIQPGLTYISKGAQGNSFGIDLGAANNVTIEKTTININYIEIPVNLLANFEISGSGKAFIGAGPYYAFALSANSKTGNVKEKGTIGSSEDDVKRGDYGVNFLGGFRLNNGLDIHLGYGLGLGNIANFSEAKMKNKVFSVGLGFSF